MNPTDDPDRDAAGAEAFDGALPLTGERTVPGLAVENYWFRRHEVIYRWFSPRCAGRDVLEAGCGEGYGADLIARDARRVTAIDYDDAAVAHVRARYPRVHALQANLAALPVGGQSVDVVVNLQVIEHLWDQGGFIAECARVLRPSGTLIVSTPNRITFSPGRDTPLNPFHTRELDAAELTELLTDRGFRLAEMYGVFHGPALREMDARHGGSIIDAQIALALAGTRWPQCLADDVAAVTVADFDIVQAPDGADTRSGQAQHIDDSLDLVAIAVRL